MEDSSGGRRLGEPALTASVPNPSTPYGKKLLKMSRSSIREPVTGMDYGALVAAQSRAIAKLSTEIVEAIRGTGKH
jgi:hypothetical protein